ncbi:hypothetical protein JD79_01646 [Geodermatophilus normandii]|uniref:Uncharacterized protein n=1 Tax=Geodermatophilus normandii TaxID=1137989 RepID=A0A317QGU8_9ACTN|nr:hypothetical protein [Geodermatophilus normandii]PWW22492.1 hypothetical protein JD79_01646 [Geodermatophilus normandii]
MADVGEEGGLGAVELGERLGAGALGGVGARVGDGAGDLRGQQLVEGPVLLVQRAVGTDADQQRPDRLASGAARQRQRHRRGHLVAERPAGHVQRGGVDVPEVGGLPCGPRQRAVVDADGGHPVQPGVLAGEVDGGEGHVERGGGERAAHLGGEVALVLAAPGRGGDLVQQPLPSLGHHLPGDLGAHRVHPGDLAVVAEGGGVGDGEVGLLAVAGALEQQEQLRDPRGLAGGHRVLDRLLQRRPALRQRDPQVVADGAGVLGADELGVGVVVELRVLRSPGQDHGEARGQDGAHGVAQAGRPVLHRPDRRRRPVEGRHQAPVLAAAGEDVLRAGAGRDVLDPGPRDGIRCHAHLQAHECGRRAGTPPWRRDVGSRSGSPFAARYMRPWGGRGPAAEVSAA